MNFRNKLLGAVLMFVLVILVSNSRAAEPGTLHAGWARTDITPETPINLVGQMRRRIAKKVHDPLTATALAIETKSEGGQKEQAIMISCDLSKTKSPIQKRVQQKIARLLTDFDSKKLFVNATHTHTGPGVVDGTYKGKYDTSDLPEVIKPSEYAESLVTRLVEAAEQAWKNRKPAGVSWGLGHAVVGYNRRVVYFDGHAKMYGKTNDTEFRCIEGYQDHAVEMLFFWDTDENLTGMILNVACPAQETEGWKEISADYWHDVRQEIAKRYSSKVYVFPQCAAAGDISPHRLLRYQAQKEMADRKRRTHRQEIANRIADAVDEVFPFAKVDIKTKTLFRHTLLNINLPKKEPPSPPFYHTDSVEPAVIHVLRLGDVAMATNPFELYLDYGTRMKARSKAILTFVVQLSCANSGYLPTEKAAKGGGYSAENYNVGPEGGQVLVDETVKQINAFWQ